MVETTEILFDVNLLQYGNPNREALPYLNTSPYLSQLFGELSKWKFTANGSNDTKEELNRTKKYCDALEEDLHMQKLYISYDKHLQKHYINFLQTYGIPPEETNKLLASITTDVMPLIMQLKMYFQRPRPFQLAKYHKLKLFPFKVLNADTPSYPSAYGLLSLIYSTVIGNQNPRLYNQLIEMSNSIGMSRLYLGLNYESDIDFSHVIASRILENKEFVLKYKL